MKKYFFLSSLVFVVACSATKMVAPTQSDVNRGLDNYPGLTLGQLTEGQQIYMATCNKCHPYKKPGSRTAVEWQRIIPEMTTKANRKLGNQIDATREASLLRYVSVMSTAGKK
jgi:cytochrome c5